MNTLVTELKKRRFEPIEKSKTFNNILREFDLHNKAVLDIGCSYGEFLAHFGKQSVGLTIVSEEARVGQEMGLDILLLNIEQDELPKDFSGKFDVIFANNIFEHMQSPHNFLLKIKKYLKSDGLLILGVPCIPKPTRLMRFKKFRGSLASLHINFFTRETLIKTVEFAGWRVEQARGFYFSNNLIDTIFNPLYPHIYACAKVDANFAEPPKRIKELGGYSV